MNKQSINQQNSTDKVGLYRLKDGDIYKNLHLCPYATLIKSGEKAYIGNYEQVYIGDLFAKDTPVKVLQRFICHLPNDFKGRPLEVGDVIAIKQHNIQSAYYIDDVAGTKILIALPSFFSKTEDEDKMTLTKGVEEHHNTIAENTKSGDKEENIPEPRLIDGKASVLDSLKIKKEEVKKYRPPEKHNEKDKDKGEEMGMDI